MKDQEELFHEEDHEGFRVRFYRLDEYMSARGQIYDEETLGRIESGFYDWFCVRVTASKAGVVLADDYLGGCCYESVEDFLTPDGYALDMRNAVVEAARAKLAELCPAHSSASLPDIEPPCGHAACGETCGEN